MIYRLIKSKDVYGVLSCVVPEILCRDMDSGAELKLCYQLVWLLAAYLLAEFRIAAIDPFLEARCIK